ncbi:MAG: hypothetical protein JXR83_22705 [Deltaproteobacteria bacterium]|nr:hypothetical protein [Deltaproteobacteria bacterium]
MRNPLLTTGILVALAAAVNLAGCKIAARQPAETLDSFAVSFNFDPAVAAAAGCGGAAMTDICPTGPGTAEQPLPYAQEEYNSFFVDIDAIGTRGTRPFVWHGEVGATLPRGTLHMQQPAIVLVNGEARGVQIRLRRAAGSTLIAIEDRLEGRNEKTPTFVAGGSPKIHFEQPTIMQVQETRDEGTSPLDRSSVRLSDGTLVVSRVTPSGFYLQDVSAPPPGDWSGLFIYTYWPPEEIWPGAQLLEIGGSVTEYLGSTQIQQPEIAGINMRCVPEFRANEGVEDTDEEFSNALLLPGCGPGATCTRLEEDRDGTIVVTHRCVLDSQPERFDRRGRRICSADNDPVCPTGTTCLLDPEENVRYCQIVPVAPPAESWPKAYAGEFPYCGPFHTERTLPLASEMVEGRLVKLQSADGSPLRIEGIPLCKHVDDITSVRSRCNIDDSVPDCELARAGERLLRDASGKICPRWYQACARYVPDPAHPGQMMEVDWQSVESTCTGDDTLPYCDTALPGEEPLRDSHDAICRSTFDEFLVGGWENFYQWKVTFTDSAGDLRCATVISDALPELDPIALQESPGTLRSITGTFKQTQFRSGSSFWIVQVGQPSDVEY